MRIRYDVTVDDLVAFALYQCGGCLRPRVPGSILWGVLATSGVVAIWAIFMGKEAVLMMLPQGIIPMFFLRLMFSKLGFRQNSRSTLRRIYEESLPREATGPHELELVEDSLVERTPYSVRRTPLEDIQRIRSDGDHTFIYFGPALAYVIPNQAVSEGDLQGLTEAIQVSLAEKDNAADRPG